MMSGVFFLSAKSFPCYWRSKVITEPDYSESFVWLGNVLFCFLCREISHSMCAIVRKTLLKELYFLRITTFRSGIVFMVVITKNFCCFLFLCWYHSRDIVLEICHCKANPVRASKCNKVSWVLAISHLKQDRRDCLPKSRVASLVPVHSVTIKFFQQQIKTSALVLSMTIKKLFLSQLVLGWNLLWFLFVVENLKMYLVIETQVKRRRVLILVYSTFSVEQVTFFCWKQRRLPLAMRSYSKNVHTSCICLFRSVIETCTCSFRKTIDEKNLFHLFEAYMLRPPARKSSNWIMW